MLQRARRVQSCVTACLASAVLCYGVLGECNLVKRHAWRVLTCFTACSASAVLHYGAPGACSFVLRHSQ